MDQSTKGEHMLDIREYESMEELNTHMNRTELVDFLYAHLGRFGDEKASIDRCLEYALDNTPGTGGFVLTGHEADGRLVGALIMNETGMKGYIPENILVYVAVHEDCRGKGYGGAICKHALNKANGDVKLHVEYDNPAKRLYERLGFSNKYAEMRWFAD